MTKTSSVGMTAGAAVLVATIVGGVWWFGGTERTPPGLAAEPLPEVPEATTDGYTLTMNQPPLANAVVKPGVVADGIRTEDARQAALLTADLLGHYAAGDVDAMHGWLERQGLAASALVPRDDRDKAEDRMAKTAARYGDARVDPTRLKVYDPRVTDRSELGRSMGGTGFSSGVDRANQKVTDANDVTVRPDTPLVEVAVPVLLDVEGRGRLEAVLCFTYARRPDGSLAIVGSTFLNMPLGYGVAPLPI